MRKQAGMVLAAILALSCAGFGQDGRFAVGISGIGALSKQSTGNQIVLSPTQGYGVVFTGQVRMGHKFSLQANLGHMDNSQKYQTTTLDYRVQSTLTEISGALVFRPFKTKNWKPFLFGGGGVLVFNPNATLVIDTNPLNLTEMPEDIGAKRQTQPAILYGGGVDHKLPLFSFLSVRLQYRGLLYNNPSYGVGNLFTGTRGHIAEPSIGLTFTF